MVGAVKSLAACGCWGTVTAGSPVGRPLLLSAQQWWQQRSWQAWKWKRVAADAGLWLGMGSLHPGDGLAVEAEGTEGCLDMT